MPIRNMQWCVEIGIFNAACKARYFKIKSLQAAAPVFCFFSFGFRFVFMHWFYLFVVTLKLNPGPKNRNSCYNLSICHWNLTSTAGHNFAKVNLPQAYNVIHDFDMICLSESYLDSSLSSDNDLYIRDYKLVRAEHLGI